MQHFRSRLWLIFAVALVGAGGFLLGAGGAGGDGTGGMAGGTGGIFSAVAAFVAVLAPSEWLRAKARGARPEAVLGLALGKFFLTVLLLAAAVVGVAKSGADFAPGAFVFGVVAAVVVGALRFRNFRRFSPQPVEIGGNS